MPALPSTITLGGELTISRLGFGTIHLTTRRGFGVARKNAVQLLRRAVELGVNFIDTADSYGPGVAEDLVCEALHPYDGMTIATKGGFEHPAEDEWTVNGRPAHLRAALEGSLERLRLEQIPLYYLHAPDLDPAVYEDSLGCLNDLKREGKIRFVGISNVTPAHLRAAHAILGDALVSVQNYYNVMFHHGAHEYYPDTEDVLTECELHEWAFVAWEPMGTGEDLPDVEHHAISRRIAEEEIATLCATHGVTPHIVRLAGVLARSKQIIAIPGTSSLAHLEENMAAMRLAEVEGVNFPWFHGRGVVTSLRRQKEIDDLMRRLSAPVDTYSASDLPDWRPRRG